jgi:hypothetical protein
LAIFATDTSSSPLLAFATVSSFPTLIHYHVQFPAIVDWSLQIQLLPSGLLKKYVIILFNLVK